MEGDYFSKDIRNPYVFAGPRGRPDSPLEPVLWGQAFSLPPGFGPASFVAKNAGQKA
jgi:hypothetical protein